MSEEADNFLAHYGIRGMKWGVKKSDTSSGSKGQKGLSYHQKQQIKTVAIGVGVAAVAIGALYAAKKINMNAPMKTPIKAGLSSPGTKAAFDKLVNASFNSNVTTSKVKDSFVSPKAAASAARGANAVKKIKMDKNLSDFMSDSARRIASDQKGWSDSLGIGLDRIAKEDQAWMANYIKNMGARAISA